MEIGLDGDRGWADGVGGPVFEEVGDALNCWLIVPGFELVDGFGVGGGGDGEDGVW